jgi:phosphatidylinositol alpha-1,6-mannosyltransferase
MSVDKRLILFSYDFPPSNGGIARLCLEIANGMNIYYNSVTVLTRKQEGESFPYNLKEVEIVALPTKRLVCELKAIHFLRKLKNKEQYDILCGTWHPESTLALISGFKNVFVLGHGTEFLSANSFFRKKIWLGYYANFILKKSKLVIANSNYTKGLIQSISTKSKNTALPLAVNHEFFKPDGSKKLESKKLKICIVSRIEQFKGHDFILNVIAQLPIEYRNVIEFNIAGTGVYANELVQLAKQLGIEDQVNFYGFVNDLDLPNFYTKNDLFILCSRENPDTISVEGFGLVFLEAQACGLAVIGTDTGGISDAIDHENGGWLIHQDNAEELRNLLISIIMDRTIITTMGTRARNRVLAGYTWEIYCSKLFELINPVASVNPDSIV